MRGVGDSPLGRLRNHLSAGDSTHAQARRSETDDDHVQRKPKIGRLAHLPHATGRRAACQRIRDRSDDRLARDRFMRADTAHAGMDAQRSGRELC